jgi:hypothetical protein
MEMVVRFIVDGHFDQTHLRGGLPSSSQHFQRGLAATLHFSSRA